MDSQWRQWQRRAHRAVLQHLRGAPFGEVRLGYVVAPTMPLLSALYERVVNLKRVRELASAKRISPKHIPVISVGNFTFGATGKTPCVMFLAELILREVAVTSAEKRVPLLLTRGYGDDEWRMFASRLPSCKVAVGSDRLAIGAESVAKLSSELSCVLLEDGLQQWKIEKDLEIVMVDALAPFGNGKLIPYGSLRESPAEALNRADIVLVHHANLVRDTERLHHISTTIKSLARRNDSLIVGTSAMAVSSLPTMQEFDTSGAAHGKAGSARDWSQFHGKTALVFCGVGNPDSVELVVRGMGCWADVVLEAFPDHHQFSLGDLEDVRDHADRIRLDAAIKRSDVVVLTTEKDYARSRALILEVFVEHPVHIIVGTFQIVSGHDEVRNAVRNLIGRRAGRGS